MSSKLFSKCDGPKDEAAQMRRILQEFPWLFAVSNSWELHHDRVVVTNELELLDMALEANAARSGILIWLYWEQWSSERSPSLRDLGVWKINEPEQDGERACWAQIIAGDYDLSGKRVKYIVLSPEGESHRYALYRPSAGEDFVPLVREIAQNHKDFTGFGYVGAYTA